MHCATNEYVAQLVLIAFMTVRSFLRFDYWVLDLCANNFGSSQSRPRPCLSHQSLCSNSWQQGLGHGDHALTAKIMISKWCTGIKRSCLITNNDNTSNGQ